MPSIVPDVKLLIIRPYKKPQWKRGPYAAALEAHAEEAAGPWGAVGVGTSSRGSQGSRASGASDSSPGSDRGKQSL